LHLSTWAIALDQSIKWWMRQNIALGEIYNVTPFLDWVHVWNRGISFGLFPCESLWSRSVLGLVTLIFIGFLVLLCTQSTTTRQRWGSGLMVAGALSNGIDRIFYRGVFDFIRMHWGSWDFPVFNLADMLITMGFLALLSEHFQWNALRLQKKRH
jgi:signal peptidase II